MGGSPDGEAISQLGYFDLHTGSVVSFWTCETQLFESILACLAET